MTRLGFLWREGGERETAAAIAALCALPGLEAEGLFTHFADADGNEEYTMGQFTRFLDARQALEALGVRFKICHCAASAAVLNYPCTHMDMVRPGIALYGYYPAPGLEGLDSSGLLPVMALKTRVAAVRAVPAGTCVSYGCTARLERDSPPGRAAGGLWGRISPPALQPDGGAAAGPALPRGGPYLHGHVHGWT